MKVLGRVPCLRPGRRVLHSLRKPGEIYLERSIAGIVELSGARPFPIGGMFAQASADRVAVYIVDLFPQFFTAEDVPIVAAALLPESKLGLPAGQRGGHAGYLDAIVIVFSGFDGGKSYRTLDGIEKVAHVVGCLLRLDHKVHMVRHDDIGP